MGLFDARLAFFTAYLKGEEARLVTTDHMNRMTKASSIQDILGIVTDTDIGSYLEETPAKTFDELDEHLWRYFSECLKRIEWFKPVPADMVKILKAHIVKYDILNIKAALQGISTGKKARSIPIGVIHNYGLLDELFGAENVDSIIELLNKCQLGDYASILRECKIDGGVSSSLMTEARLDEMYYKNLLNMTKDIGDGSILAKAFGIMIDMTNLRVILRGIIAGTQPEVNEWLPISGYMIPSEAIKELLPLKLRDIPGRLDYSYQGMAEEVVTSYDRTKSITVVEEIIDRYRFRLSKEKLSLILLSPLVVAWYLILKETEIRNLRLILKAMFDNVPLEEIKSYLVLPS